jgi:hypothetical protein
MSFIDELDLEGLGFSGVVPEETKEDLRELKAHSKTRTPVVAIAREVLKASSAGLGHRR